MIKQGAIVLVILGIMVAYFFAERDEGGNKTLAVEARKQSFAEMESNNVEALNPCQKLSRADKEEWRKSNAGLEWMPVGEEATKKQDLTQEAADYCAPMGCCDVKDGECLCEACRNKLGTGNDGCNEERSGHEDYPYSYNMSFVPGRAKCCVATNRQGPGPCCLPKTVLPEECVRSR